MSAWLLTSHCLKPFPKISPDLRSRNYRVNPLSSRQCPDSEQRFETSLHTGNNSRHLVSEWSSGNKTQSHVLGKWQKLNLDPGPPDSKVSGLGSKRQSTHEHQYLRHLEPESQNRAVYTRLKNLNENPSCLPGLQLPSSSHLPDLIATSFSTLQLQ